MRKMMMTKTKRELIQTLNQVTRRRKVANRMRMSILKVKLKRRKSQRRKREMIHKIRNWMTTMMMMTI